MASHIKEVCKLQVSWKKSFPEYEDLCRMLASKYGVQHKLRQEEEILRQEGIPCHHSAGDRTPTGVWQGYCSPVSEGHWPSRWSLQLRGLVDKRGSQESV